MLKAELEEALGWRLGYSGLHTWLSWAGLEAGVAGLG
jgi:hypothetical protein